jgi:hypothetical protein
MKIAVCISGGIRYPHLGVQSISKIIPNDSIKVFIHTWNVRNRDEFLKTVAGLQYKEQDKTLDDNYSILNEYNYEKLLIENYDTHRIRFENILSDLKFSSFDEYDECIKPRYDVGPISMHYSIYRSNELKKEYEIQNNMIFDRVIRMRFDSDFEGKVLDLTKLTDDICIPEGEDWCYGINDQFALGSSQGMDIYSCLFNNLERLQCCKYHPETMFRKHLEYEQVQIRRFNFNVVINNRIDFRKVWFG